LSENDRIKLREESVTYTYITSLNRYLTIPFETLQEYLALLESVAKQLSVLNERVMFYLAAAVSDFYIPDEEVRVHSCSWLFLCL
jgi:phosphopantothenate-cysteine ligase